MQQPLMPKATAIWLIENTCLTFEQISEFCGLHFLEVKSIADDDYGVKIKGLDPIISGQLTKEEIERCQKDQKARLRMQVMPDLTPKSKGKRKKYTPISKRQDKPEAINWIVKNHPEISDAQIVKLIGTTKTTIASIREKTHWNIKDMRALDPVIAGLCTQSELDEALRKAEKNIPVSSKSSQLEQHGLTLSSFSENNNG